MMLVVWGQYSHHYHTVCSRIHHQKKACSVWRACSSFSLQKHSACQLSWNIFGAFSLLSRDDIFCCIVSMLDRKMTLLTLLTKCLGVHSWLEFWLDVSLRTLRAGLRRSMGWVSAPRLYFAQLITGLVLYVGVLAFIRGRATHKLR